jgi:hypothetical protein
MAHQSVLEGQQLHYNTQAIHRAWSDKGIFWSIMLESRSHMSPNVSHTKTVLFLNKKYLPTGDEYEIFSLHPLEIVAGDSDPLFHRV